MRDTHSRIEAIQNEMFRRRSPGENFERTLRLSDWALRMSKRAIQLAHPEMNEEDQKLLFIEVHYGKELSHRVRQYLQEKRGHRDSK